jgi:GH24 family phage-related lysozyme (muramidase)
VRKEGYTGLIRSDYQLKGEDNRVWSKEELVDLFKVDINSFERGVLRLSPILANHQSKFDSCVSMAYNAGLGNYQRSTIRMKVNREDWNGAAEAFMSWTKAGGKEVAGLVKRRKAEVALFLS